MVAIALTALVPGSVLAQERGGGSDTADKRVDKKKPVKKGKKHKGTGKPHKPSKVDSAGSSGALSKRPPAAGNEIEFVVKSSPRGAAIEIDGVSFGATPVKVRSRTGRRVVSAKLAGYADAATTIQVEDGLGYLVFSLAREEQPAKVADKAERPSPGGATSGFGTKKLKYSDAIQKARMSLKREDHDAALRYAQAALASRQDDDEAKMIATIASCGVGDGSGAKRYLPQSRGSYREISITRCARLGIELP